MNNGTARRVAEAAKAGAVAYFDKVKPDPSVELAAEGTAKLKEFKPDTVVALGGGSAMDCAKAMAYFSKEKVTFVAIPTTSGSGSEVTDFAILTHDKVKHPLVDPKLRPAVAILDGDLLGELPPGLIADTGFDVIAHGLEAYVARNAGGITDALARDAVRTVLEALSASFAGDRAVRQWIHLASCMAGMAFTQAGLGLCHAMSHGLGGAFHVPHGRLNAILLPWVVEYNSTGAGAKYAELARGVGLPGAADTVALRNLKNALTRLRKQLGLPATLAQAGVQPQLVRERGTELAEVILADPCCATNPVAVDRAAVLGILETVAGHG